ncbi:MAG TPA: CHASE3 domain-containing protein [Terriglobales bacterium]|nr:CHASE3 domain-containing protein [Terriglobales bacterium]
MRYLSSGISWIVFVAGVLLLLIVAVAADHTTALLADSEKWVSHTHEVETVVAQVRSELFAAQVALSRYSLTADESHLGRYTESVQNLRSGLGHLRSLTADNTAQQQRLNSLVPIVDSRLALIERDVASLKTTHFDRQQQALFEIQSQQLNEQAIALLEEMQNEEDRLLDVRESISERSYGKLRVWLIVIFISILIVLLVTFRQTFLQLRERRRAENAVRRLSARLLQAQDEERRKIARELHDGLGQYLAALKMNLVPLESPGILEDVPGKSKVISESLQLLDQAIAESRTLSYLLHPPLLDETGFASAAQWYVEGFSQRSKIQVQLELPSKMQRMPPDIELALFRVLQEGLTNILRHSESLSAEVRLQITSSKAILSISDHGKGMPITVLQQFNQTTTGTGVGLAGMRERVNEFGGRLTVESAGAGTVLMATIPLRQNKDVLRASTTQSNSAQAQSAD